MTDDPRLAALAHAENAGELSDVASAIACGLIYVGDQIRELSSTHSGVEQVANRIKAIAAGMSDNQMRHMFGPDLERAALRQLEGGARDVDRHLSGGELGGPFTLAGQPVKDDDLESALLILHDQLNDVRCAREDPDTYAAYLADPGPAGDAPGSSGGGVP